MYRVPIESKDQLLSIRDGTFKPVIDKFSRISKVKTIIHYYYLRKEETVQDIQRQKEIDNEMVRSWLKDHPVQAVQKSIREFIPYKIKENEYVALRVACKYMIKS